MLFSRIREEFFGGGEMLFSREESGGGASGRLERGDDLAKTRKGKEVRSGIRKGKNVTQNCA